MSISFSMAGSTAKSGPSLCRTCKFAQTVTGQNGEEIIKCDSFSKFLNFRVATCSVYHPSNMPWKYEMEEIAWLVEARKRGPVGFKPGDPEMEYVIVPPNRGEGGPSPEEAE